MTFIKFTTSSKMDKYIEFKRIIGPLRVYGQELLSKHTYFKIGGLADLFFEAKNTEDLILALETAQKLKIPYVVLGGGANVLVSDNGFRGVVIKNKTDGVKLVGIKGKIGRGGTGISEALIWTASGTLMNRLARFTIDENLEGLEFLLSVPGTVGGGIKINSHYQVERGEFIGNTLVAATLFDPTTFKNRKVDHDYFNFGYDSSKIQDTGEIVIDATFRLKRAADKEILWQRAMGGVKTRNEEQPVGVPCSGCIFRNISHDDAMRLATPNITTSTGYIIESLGLKGAKVGQAQISELHANYILNNGNATAKDVANLIDLVREKAKKTYGLELDEEIFRIGKFNGKVSS